MPFKSRDATLQTAFHVEDSEVVIESTARIKHILDAKYEKANLYQVVDSCIHLKSEEREQLLQLLKKHESLFDGTLGDWKGAEYHIELKPGARSYPIPKIHEETTKKEVERLCQIGVQRRLTVLLGWRQHLSFRRRMVLFGSYQTFVN
jgi:hypothetical protein